MQRTTRELVQPSERQHHKTQEMVLGPLGEELAVPLTVSSTVVERVPVCKILGVMVSSE